MVPSYTGLFRGRRRLRDFRLSQNYEAIWKAG
jgi:hypothetical protein